MRRLVPHGPVELEVLDHLLELLEIRRFYQVAVGVKEIAPDVPVLMLTGFGELLIAKGEKPDGVDIVTGKPVKIQDLREAVAEAIRKIRRRVHNKKEKEDG